MGSNWERYGCDEGSQLKIIASIDSRG
jgi:hypothetical protein